MKGFMRVPQPSEQVVERPVLEHHDDDRVDRSVGGLQIEEPLTRRS
jgi:hypothetical protein